MLNVKLTKNRTFVFCFCILTLVSVAQLFWNCSNFKYYFHQDKIDPFMDLYNSVIAEKSHIGVPPQGFYPPLSIIPYRIMGYGIKDNNSALPPREQAFELRNSVYGAFLLFIQIMPFLISFFIIAFLMIDGNQKRKLFYSLLLSFSGLMLLTLERGNIIVYALIFTLLFVFLYHSEDVKRRYLAYICLAIAANLKLYPAIFGLLVIEKKDWNGVIKCIGSFLLIYLISFLLCCIKLPAPKLSVSIGANQEIYASFGLFKSIADMIKSVFVNVINGFKWGEGTATYGAGMNLSIINLCKLGYLFILKIQNLGMENAEIIRLYYVNHIVFYRVIACIFLIIGIFSFFFAKEKWKKWAIPAFLCFYIPPMSGMYVLMFMVIPFLDFINSEQESLFDYLYSVVFAIIFALLIIPLKVDMVPYAVTGSFALQCMALLFMYFCIFISSVRNLFNIIRKKDYK